MKTGVCTRQAGLAAEGYMGTTPARILAAWDTARWAEAPGSGAKVLLLNCDQSASLVDASNG